MRQNRNSSEADDAADAPGGGPVEWTVAAISAVIVAAMIGFLALEALDTTEATPVPVAAVADIAPSESGFRVEIDARNTGGATAASVRFRAALQRAGQTVETAQVTFDFLPAQSSRAGAVIFANDPRLYDVVIQAESYTTP